MKRSILLAVLALSVWGCASSEAELLNREYELFRFEQQKYRREELEKLYREEKARSDALRKEILELRAEIDRLERVRSELTGQRDAMKGQSAGR
jgi:hypothetical protein